MKAKIMNFIKELSYEDALEVRAELNKHIEKKELKIKELLCNKKKEYSFGKISSATNVIDCIGEMIRDNGTVDIMGVKISEKQKSYKCNVCGSDLIYVGADYVDYFDCEMTELFKCENYLCGKIHERSISRDPNSDKQDALVLRYR